MKAALFVLLNVLLFPCAAFSQKSSPGSTLHFDGVYFTKPSRQDSLTTWSVRCLRFYPGKTVILTSEVYPAQGFDMSRFGKYFSKENLPPETARGTYRFRNDSLVFSTESYFSGETKQHTIKNDYKVLTITTDSIVLERRTPYDETEIRTFYFKAFRKVNQK